MKRHAVICAFALLAAGCATWSFTPLRTQRFVDDDNRYIVVDYGREDKARESVFTTPAGLKLPFRSKLKVRVEMPDGVRFVAYQRMSASGNLYITDDGQWEYFEEGVACIVAERAPSGRGYLARYQGVLCASVRNSTKPRSGRMSGSTPSDFRNDSKGPRDSSGPPTVE